MIAQKFEVQQGFQKADVNNIPVIHRDMILKFLPKIGRNSASTANISRSKTDSDTFVDYAQVRKSSGVCEVQAVVFSDARNIECSSQGKVMAKVNEKTDAIIDTGCEQCPKNESCSHILAFLFWLHRKCNESTPAVNNFWGTESEYLTTDEENEVLRIRDLVSCDELRSEVDLTFGSLHSFEGINFLQAFLDEMRALNIRDSALYQHCRPTITEFEPLFVHHTLLGASNTCVKDTRTFIQHMEDQSKQGLFDRLTTVSRNSYKMPLWLEVQYMRLRCSLIHRIVSRKDALDDEAILEKLFCKSREYSGEERQQLKQHKRFILKQTEKLENKTYQECGILLNESYPYICAAPDGITDDHIVEIKAPKTEDEFEKYLEGRETIAPKYMAQIQIQMYMANVTKALYCVLSPTFDTNGALHYVWVQADMEFVASLLGAAEDFWKDVVFPRLSKIYLNNI